MDISRSAAAVSLVAVLGLALRSVISLQTYSGRSASPMFGDFEAQRHWQEITLNVPIQAWYQQTPDNDLQYWGLDYPPLTAYHSYLNGLVANRINSSYVELKTSRGITTEHHKYFMRLTVLLMDAFLYLPCVYYAIRQVQWKLLLKAEQNPLVPFLMAAIYPGQILIDNGHFQYNNISLGLAILSVGLMIRSRFCWGALIFTLALNYKQMELYHSLPIFFYLLAQCVPGLSAGHCKWAHGIGRLFKIGFTVVTTMTILYSPWMSDPDALKQVFIRLFPIARGVFEDKVSNFWCILNVFYKIKEHFSNEDMAKICLISTLAAALPTNIYLFFKATVPNFLQSLVITSLAFFLFSFQVHEKTILLVCAPVLLLLPVVPEKKWLILFLQTATFSMTPLLRKDGLIMAYFALSAVFIFSFVLLHEFCSTDGSPRNNVTWERAKLLLCSASIVVQNGLVVALIVVAPPAGYPFLFELLIAAFSAGHFLLYFLYFYVQQLFVKGLIVQ